MYVLISNQMGFHINFMFCRKVLLCCYIEKIFQGIKFQVIFWAYLKSFFQGIKFHVVFLRLAGEHAVKKVFADPPQLVWEELKQASKCAHGMNNFNGLSLKTGLKWSKLKYKQAEWRGLLSVRESLPWSWKGQKREGEEGRWKVYWGREWSCAPKFLRVLLGRLERGDLIHRV